MAYGRAYNVPLLAEITSDVSRTYDTWAVAVWDAQPITRTYDTWVVAVWDEDGIEAGGGPTGIAPTRLAPTSLAPSKMAPTSLAGGF